MAEKQNSLKLNFIMNAILTMSSFVFPLITFPYVSRILLPEGMGKVAFAKSFISYFALFAQMGIPTYGIRICAKVRDNKDELSRTVHEIFFLNLVMSVIAYIGLFLTLAFVPRLYDERSLYIIVSLSIFCTVIGMEWLYKALEQYTYITVRSIICNCIALVALFLLVHEQDDYIIYGGITIFATSASYIFNFIHINKYVVLRPLGGYNIVRHLKGVAIFFAMSCATIIYTHLDTVMIGFMATDADVGYYDTAVKIKYVLVSFVTSLGTVLLPRASYYVKSGQMDEFRKITEKALNFVFLIASPLMLYFILFAKQGIYLLFGSAYEASIVPMQIILPTLLLIGLTNTLGIQILVPLGREKIVLISEVAGAAVNLIINALLIPRMLSTGAAIGTLVAEFVVLVVQFAALRNECGDAFRKIRYMHIMVALAIGTVASLWVRMMEINDFTILVISALLFFGSYTLFLLFAKEPLVVEIYEQIIGKVFKKKTSI
ncbi:MAG: flippase [Lachnospiraceae bacterium]|nr:flippase [Lachnospiraceae bacterium]